MQCPPRPQRCRWPCSCPADSASAGQSLPDEPPPGTCQRYLVAEDEEVLPDFLFPWKGCGRALPAPARKGGSCVTVLCVVDGGEPDRSSTEGLGAVFLDDVFVLVLTSFCLAKVTDEPVIQSACLMARTRDLVHDLWFRTHHMVTFKRSCLHCRKNWGLEVEVLEEGITT